VKEFVISNSTSQFLAAIQAHPQGEFVLQVVDTLKGAGHQAFIVGGAVRDLLLGLVLKDFDVATSAKPDQVESLFPKTVPIGKEFGVILVVGESKDLQVEVTTFRKESDYNKKRQPQKIEFADLQGDASRRDFTINALYFDPREENFVDPFGGQKDLKNHLLRAVGDAEERLTEDPLRILRALRFSAVLQLKMDSSLKSAIGATVGLVKELSKERVFEEIQKVLKSNHWLEAFDLYESFKLFEVLEICPGQNSNLKCLFKLSNEDRSQLENFGLEEKWAMYWSEAMMEKVDESLQNLKASKGFRKRVLFDLQSFEAWLDEDLRQGERILLLSKSKEFGLEAKSFKEYLGLRMHAKFEGESLKDQTESLEDVFRAYESLVNAEGDLPKPLVTGEVLSSLKINQGPLMGALIEEFYLRQIEGNLKSLEGLEDQVKEFLRTSIEV
tara:strand:- start:29161 stop:30486 length:1326 start_codon:yes stop_codon:yes gene_type:complete